MSHPLFGNIYFTQPILPAQTYDLVNPTGAWKAIISLGAMGMELWGALTAVALCCDRALERDLNLKVIGVLG